MGNGKDITTIATERLVAFLENKQMRKTPERFEILKVICQIPGIFSVEDLGEIMQKHGAFNVSRTTLFNTLELLVNAQLVIKHTLTRAAHYECNIFPTPHICQVCIKCGSIEKVEDHGVITYLQELKIKPFCIQQAVLYLHGLCRKCTLAQKKKNKPKR